MAARTGVTEMAYLLPTSAIFSPSAARQAASSARDWSYVDRWLASKFGARTVPAFERNSDTLEALVALAAFNETADEKRELFARVEADTLRNLQIDDGRRRDGNGRDEDNCTPATPTPPEPDLHTALEDSLTQQGKAALDAMALAAVHLRMPLAEPAQLTSAMLKVQIQAFDTEQASARLATLQQHLGYEASNLSRLLDQVRGHDYRPPADLPSQNLDMQRQIRDFSKNLADMRDRATVLARTVEVPNPTIQHVAVDVDKYRLLFISWRDLDLRLSGFEGLPPDVDMARRQLDGLREQLRISTERRDAIFEGLSEREIRREKE